MTAVVLDVGNVLIRREPRLLRAGDFRCVEIDVILLDEPESLAGNLRELPP